MKNKLVAAMLICATIPAFAQTGPAWAWTAGKITNNGSVTVKSASGAATYDAVKNPIGAVVKTNQSAVTQPPTVIIQATSAASQYVEAMPLIATTSNTTSVMPVPPSCPAGFTAVWTKVIPSYGKGFTFNVAGTRFSFGLYNFSSNTYVGWLVDGGITAAGVTTSYQIADMTGHWSSQHTAGTLCVK